MVPRKMLVLSNSTVFIMKPFLTHIAIDSYTYLAIRKSYKIGIKCVNVHADTGV